MADITVTNNGSTFSFQVLSSAAREWFDENVQSEDWQWLGARTLVVDHHYAENLYAGIVDAGLTVEG